MEVKTITPKGLWELRKGGSPIELIDVRSSTEFDEVHAEIAWSVPLDGLDPTALVKARKGSSDDPLYFICKSGSRGEKAAKRLIDAGFHNVINVEGGTSAWKEANLPIVKATRAISLDRQVRIGAGLVVGVASLLSLAIHPGYAFISLVVGIGLVYAGATNWCGMTLFLERMPWNRLQS